MFGLYVGPDWMMNRTHFLLLILLSFVVAACAAEDAERPPTVRPTLEPADPSDEPIAPTATAVQVTATPTEDLSSQEMALSGRLYYVGFVNQEQHLLVLDLATGQESSLFVVPEDAWLSEVAVSPTGDRLLLAYAPSPGQNQIQYGFTALHVMPADGSGDPELLVDRADPSETFYNISWPMDDMVYYARYAPSIDETGAVTYVSSVERAHLPGGEVELLVTEAAWPRLSNDGSQLAYVTEGGEMMIAEADGASPQLFLGADVYAAVDAPLFSPDGDQLYFSAVDLEPSASLSPLDKLLGVQIAQAHSVPSDWWRGSTSSELERLTTIDKVGLYGDFSADGRQLFFAAADGLYVMGPAGEDLTQLQSIPTLATIDWTP